MNWKKGSNVRHLGVDSKLTVLFTVGVFCHFVIAGVTTGCATVDDETNRDCPVNISLVSGSFETAGDVLVEFQADGIDRVFVPSAGPQVFELDPTDNGGLATESICEPISASEDVPLRVFHFDTGLWTTAWDRVASVDADGLHHIPAGFYRVVIVYSMEREPAKNGKISCRCSSPPFEVKKPSIRMVERD